MGVGDLRAIGMTIGTLYQKRFGGEIEWRTGFLVQYARAAALFALGAFATETMVVRWTGEFSDRGRLAGVRRCRSARSGCCTS